MALEGDIVASLTLDHSRFDKGLKDSAKIAGSFGGKLGGLTAMLDKHKMSLTQAAFAADDFFGVLGTSGNVGAAIRATSNNIGTLVTMINPLAGLATTLALSLGSMLIPKLFETGDAAESASVRAEKLADRLKGVEDSARQMQAIVATSNRIANLFDADAIAAERGRIEDELDVLRQKMAFLWDGVHIRDPEQFKQIGDQIAELEVSLRRLDANDRVADFNAQLARSRDLGRIGQIGNFDTLAEEIGQSRDALSKMNRELEALQHQRIWIEESKLTNQGGMLRDIDAAMRTRTEAIDAVRERLTALEKREAELLHKGMREGLPEAEPQGRLDDLAKELSRSFEMSLASPLEKRLLSIRNRFADAMDRIRKEFDGEQEKALLSQASSALQAELSQEQTKALPTKGPQSPEAAQRGTAQAYSAILRAIRGDANSKQIKHLSNMDKNIGKLVQQKPAKDQLAVVEKL